MKNNRMTADNVEQLMEIVRAVQRGEEPEEVLRRKEAESAPVADSPKSNLKIVSESEKKRVMKKIKSAEEDDAETEDDFGGDFGEDEFEKILNEDGTKQLNLRFNFEKASEGLRAKAGAAAEKLRKLKADGHRKKKKTDEVVQEDETPELNVQESEPADSPSADFSNADFSNAADLNTNEEMQPENAEAADAQEALANESDAEPLLEKTEDQKTIDRLFDKIPEHKMESEQAGTDETESGKAESDETESGKAGTDETKSGKAGSDETKSGKARPDETESGKAESGKQSADKTHRIFAQKPFVFSPAGVRDYVRDLFENLRQRGIAKKELGMIGVGLVLAILIVHLVINGISASMEEKKKSENVTADAGLKVTVESEPDKWCSSYPAVLKFKAGSRKITSVLINEVPYKPDENGTVAFMAEDWLLEAVAVTEEGELQARIELPMIDAQPPVVDVKREQDQIILTAADARSQVKKIWYAVVGEDAYMEIPLYEQYIEPIPFEAGKMYYFYAEDMAGNRSTPIVTTMELPETMTLAHMELQMFPMETQYLQPEVTPKGALLTNLHYESMQPDIVSVDSNGAVTALKEGNATVKVSADGMPELSCSVTVSRERTVTVSAIGDCTLGTDESFNTTTSFQAFDAVNGHSYFFKNVKEVLEKDDVTFANFEGTLTKETTRAMKEYAFRGDPSYTEILKSGSVEVVTLANNHTSDYGEKSLEDTKTYLTEAGIDYCIGDTIAMREINGIRTAFIGIYVLNDGMAREQQVRDTIAAAKDQGAQLVITAFHWGTEKATQPDETQMSLAHTAVDCGADLVVGHHPHVLQGIEKYNGKYIVYSLGNFCFGGNSTPSDTDSLIFRQTFTISEGAALDDDRIELIPCSISSVAGYNNYQPMIVTGTEAERIIGRINEYSAPFGKTYTASAG